MVGHPWIMRSMRLALTAVYTLPAVALKSLPGSASQ